MAKTEWDILIETNEHLEARLKAAEERNDSLQRQREITGECLRDAQETVATLLERNAKLEAALKIYADPKNHSDDFCYCGYGVARKALAADEAS
jgi:hypothetical protein